MVRLCVKMETALQHHLSQSLSWHWGRFAKILVLVLPETPCLSLLSTEPSPAQLDLMAVWELWKICSWPSKGRFPLEPEAPFMLLAAFLWVPIQCRSPAPSPAHTMAVSKAQTLGWLHLSLAAEGPELHWAPAAVPWPLPLNQPLVTGLGSGQEVGTERRKEKGKKKPHIQLLMPEKNWLPSVCHQNNLWK